MTWEPKHTILMVAVLTTPILLTTMIALVRGYSMELRFWRKGEEPHSVRLVREKEDDDESS